MISFAGAEMRYAREEMALVGRFPFPRSWVELLVFDVGSLAAWEALLSILAVDYWTGMWLLEVMGTAKKTMGSLRQQFCLI